MNAQIVLKKWFVKSKDDKMKVIAGEYAVMCGSTEVVKREFNDGYSCTAIAFPTELLVRIEALEDEVRKHVEAGLGVSEK